MINIDKVRLARLLKCSVKRLEESLEAVIQSGKRNYGNFIGDLTEDDILTYFRILTDTTLPGISPVEEKLSNGLYWVAHLKSKYLEKGMKEGEDLSKMKIRHKLGL